MKRYLAALVALVAFAPYAYAQESSLTPKMDAFIAKVGTEIVDPLITVLALAAFAVFVWGMVVFIRNADNDEKRKVSQMHMLWGIIGLALIFGAAAIVNVIKNIAGAG